MFYIFAAILIITIIIWIWSVFYYKKPQEEQIVYEYSEEVPVENYIEENSQNQTNELIESIKNA